jgi:hypothetical protein
MDLYYIQNCRRRYFLKRVARPVTKNIYLDVAKRPSGKNLSKLTFFSEIKFFKFCQIRFFAVIAFFPESWQDRASQERRHKRHLQPFNEENRKIEDEYRIRGLCSSFLRDGGIKKKIGHIERQARADQSSQGWTKISHTDTTSPTN